MRSRVRHAHHARRHRVEAGEELLVDPLGWNAPARETGGQIIHEPRWPAEIEVGVTRNTQRTERSDVEMSGGVIMLAQPVVSAGPAVADVAVAARERPQQSARIKREGMALAVARSI